MNPLTRKDAVLLVVDFQERLAAAMDPSKLDRVLNRAGAAIEGARALGLPIIVTEQYPKGLGPTLSVIKNRMPDFTAVEKIEFSAWLPSVRELIGPRTQALVVGMETHVCVFQTVRDLAKVGITPHVAVDAVLSRNTVDHDIGIDRCQRAGGLLTTVESALFEILGRAGSPEFKAVSAAVK